MNRAIRRRLRVLAWFAFVVLVPLVLSSARGYRVTSIRHARLGEPIFGALVIRTVPRGAIVALDGHIVDQQTPTGIGSVPAGTHRVRIEKFGYRPYEKEISVAGGRVTDLLHVRLLPRVFTERTLRVGVTDFWISPDEQRVILKAGAQMSLVGLRALTDNLKGPTKERATERQIRLSVRPADTIDVLWSPDSSRAALTRRGDRGAVEVIGLLDTEEAAFTRLPPRRQSVGWLTTASDHAFLVLSPDRDLLGVYARRTETLAKDVLAAAIHPGGVLIQRQAAHAPVLGILNDTLVFTPLARQEATPFSQLAVSRQGNIAAASADDKSLFVLPLSKDSRWQRLGGTANLLAWSPDGNLLAYQESAFDLWTLNVSEERSNLPRGIPELVVRLSSPVNGVQWFSDGQHLLFLTRDLVEFVEVNPTDRRPVENLTSTNRGATRMATLHDGNELWVTARRDNQDVLLQVRLTADE